MRLKRKRDAVLRRVLKTEVPQLRTYSQKFWWLVPAGVSIVLLLAGCSPQEAPGAPSQMTQPNFIISTVYFILMMLLVYFVLVIHPARLKDEERSKFVKGLKKNDEVVTSGGIYGRVVTVKPEYILLEIAANVKIRVEPRHVHAVPKEVSGGGSEQDKSSPKK